MENDGVFYETFNHAAQAGKTVSRNAKGLEYFADVLVYRMPSGLYAFRLDTSWFLPGEGAELRGRYTPSGGKFYKGGTIYPFD